MAKRWGKKVRVVRRAVFAIAVVAAVFRVDSELMAQGCAMCKSSAQALAQFSPLNAGVVVLGVPPVMIFALFLYLAFRRQP